MSDYQTLQAQIAEWANRQDWSSDLVASFIAMAEQKMNADLRVDRMIATAENTVTDSCATLPDDWLQTDLLLVAADTPTGWFPLHYKDRDQFFRLPSTTNTHMYPWNSNSTYGYYTIEGRTLFFGGPPDAMNGITYQMSYYGEVPVMAVEGSSWIYTKYPALYLYASLMHADLHAVGEEQTAMGLGQMVDQMIQKLNMVHQYARSSGSTLARGRRRSFG